jgi:hypothetical protein
MKTEIQRSSEPAAPSKQKSSAHQNLLRHENRNPALIRTCCAMKTEIQRSSEPAAP